METSFSTSEEWYEWVQNWKNTGDLDQRVFLCIEFIKFCTRDEAAFIHSELQKAAVKRRQSHLDALSVISELLSRCIHTLTKKKIYYTLKNGVVESNVPPLSFNSISADSEAEAAEFLEYVYTG